MLEGGHRLEGGGRCNVGNVLEEELWLGWAHSGKKRRRETAVNRTPRTMTKPAADAA